MDDWCFAKHATPYSLLPNSLLLRLNDGLVELFEHQLLFVAAVALAKVEHKLRGIRLKVPVLIVLYQGLRANGIERNGANVVVYPKQHKARFVDLLQRYLPLVVVLVKRFAKKHDQRGGGGIECGLVGHGVEAGIAATAVYQADCGLDNCSRSWLWLVGKRRPASNDKKKGCN